MLLMCISLALPEEPAPPPTVGPKWFPVPLVNGVTVTSSETKPLPILIPL